MPNYSTWDDDGKPVIRYFWPACYVTPIDGISEALREWRRITTRDREEFLAFQKACGQDDKEYARFFKEYAKHQLRLTRACNLMLPSFDTSEPSRETSRYWPIDLESELDEISSRIMLAFG